MSQSDIEKNLIRLDPEEDQRNIPVTSYWKYGTSFMVIFVLLVGGLIQSIGKVSCESGSEIPCIELNDLVWLSMLAGAIGASIHAMTSFALFAGKGQLTEQWLWWVYLRIPIGTLLALLVCLAMLSGVFSEKIITANEQHIFLVALVSGLAGMFSKQVAEKLSDTLNFVFGLKPSETSVVESTILTPKLTTVEERDEHAGVDHTQTLLGLDKTIQTIQERLIALGYLEALRSDGRRFDDGMYGSITRAAVEAYLLTEELVGEDRIDTLGEETDPDFWTHLLALLDDSVDGHSVDTEGENNG